MKTATKEQTMTTKQTINLGITIHDETVEMHETGRRWKLTLDGQIYGTYDSFENIITRASRLIPEHLRTNNLPLLPFIPR